jgi:hypothetical protein
MDRRGERSLGRRQAGIVEMLREEWTAAASVPSAGGKA